MAAIIPPSADRTPVPYTPGNMSDTVFDIENGLVRDSPSAILRCLAAAAEHDNPFINPPLLGAKPWIVLKGAWAPTTVYVAGTDLVTNGGNTYLCTKGGTSAGAGGPTTTPTVTDITDNTVRWIWWPFTVGEQRSNNGLVYEVTVAGVPSNVAGGPTGRGVGITDGTITWDYVGKQTAPVVTVSDVHNAAISGSHSTITYLTDNVGFFRYSGGVPMLKSAAGVALQAVNATTTGNGNTGGNLGNGYHAVIERFSTIVEDSICELETINNQGVYGRIIVDGSYVSDPYIMASGGGSRGYITLDWTNAGGYARRNVIFEGNINNHPGNLRTSLTGSVSYAAVMHNFSAAYIGDSMVANTGATWTGAGYPQLFMHLAGLPDIVNMGIGGTGILNPGTGAKYSDRVYSDLAKLNAFRPLGAIFIQASGNDNATNTYISSNGFTRAFLKTKIAEFIQTIRTAYPLVPIFVTGWITNTNDGGSYQAASVVTEGLWSEVVAAQQATGDRYIAWWPCASDPMGAWVKGTGHVGATTGDGNADFDICATDFVHPSNDGHKLMAIKNVAAYRAALAAMP